MTGLALPSAPLSAADHAARATLRRRGLSPNLWTQVPPPPDRDRDAAIEAAFDAAAMAFDAALTAAIVPA